MKQKCLLARAFLRGRQYHSRTKCGKAAAEKNCDAILSVDIIPHFSLRVKGADGQHRVYSPITLF